MAGLLPIGNVTGLLSSALGGVAPAAPAGASFTDLLTAGLKQVDARVGQADALVRAFAEGQAVPVHQVTLALEQARLAVELATQIRTRLIETYREFMTMQV